MVGTARICSLTARCRGVWLLAAAGILLGSASAGGGPAVAGELRVGVPRLPATLDPASVASAGGSSWPEPMILRLVFQGLVEVADRGEIEPGLATQWTVSRDGLTWTFRLRPDVRLHDGSLLGPDHVVASLSRHLSSEEAPEGAPPWAGLFHGAARLVREVRPGEAGTVQLQLSQPFSPLLAVLAHPALAIAVTPTKEGEVRLLGTGPYRWGEQAPGRLVLEAFGGRGGGPPRADRLVFHEMADDAAGLGALGPLGGLDVYFPQSPPAWAGIGLQVLSAPSWQVGLLALRTDRGALRQKAVRQAIALSLDPALILPALGRWAGPLSSYLPPGAWAARETPLPAHDPTRARRLLAQAGSSVPALTLLAPETLSGPDASLLAEAIRLSLAASGFTVTVRAEPEDAALHALRQGETDLAIHEVPLGINDPHFFFRPLLASEAARPGNATNVAFFRSPLVDGMLLRASQLAFRPERLRLYHRIQTHLAEELPYIPLHVRQQWVVARPTVRGLRLDPSGLHRLEQAWVEAAPDLAAPPAPATPPSAVVPPRFPAPPVPPLPPPGAPSGSGR